MIDIYFEPNYGKLYEKMEQGRCEVFNYANDFGAISHMVIKREISTSENGEKWYDLTTPYGYGGPLITSCREGKEQDLVSEFHDSFAQYCTKENIVSEFVRFHPVAANHKWFQGMYEVEYSRKTVGTDLARFDDPVQEEFSKSCRKDIRRALKNGVDFRITESPEDVSGFKEIYYSTMDRNNAGEFYYFDEQYFEDCHRYFKDKILIVEAIYEGKTIAMGFYFIYNNTIHTHLSGTLTEFLYLSPAYVLRYAVTQWGKEKGYKLIHHGGGKSSIAEDSLYQFKKRFGENTGFDYYVGRKIWNPEKYQNLCSEKGLGANCTFFPVYRAK